jgi:hypothetical protein
MTKKLEEKLVTTGDYTKLDRFEIQPISGSRDLFDVYRVAHDFYVSKEALVSRPDRIWSCYPQFDLIAQTTILVACVEGEIVGSISYTRDGSRGLVSDTTFARTCMLIRTEEKPLAEIWRLVIHPESPAKDKLAATLLKTATEKLAAEGFQTCLLSVHPEFMPVCQSLVNSVLLAGGIGTAEQNAPGLFMRCNLESLAPAARKIPSEKSNVI